MICSLKYGYEIDAATEPYQKMLEEMKQSKQQIQNPM